MPKGTTYNASASLVRPEVRYCARAHAKKKAPRHRASAAPLIGT